MRYTNIERVKAAVMLAGDKFTISEIANTINKSAKVNKYKISRQGVRDIMCRLKNAGELFTLGFNDGELIYTTINPRPQHHMPKLQPGVLSIRTYTHNKAGNRVVKNYERI